MSSQAYYERYWTSEGYNPRRDQAPPFLERWFDKHIGPTDDCLDVGCGDGGTSGAYLAGHAKSYVGVDISENAVAIARSRGLEALQVQDASALPFDDGSFDVVVCVEVLEHLFEPHRAAAEALRVLRPGGRYIVTVPNAAYWRDRFDALLGIWQPGGDDVGRAAPWRSPHIRFFTPATLRRLLIQAGFDRVRVAGVPAPLMGRVPLFRRIAHRPSLGARLGASSIPSLLAGGVAAVAVVTPQLSRKTVVSVSS